MVEGAAARKVARGAWRAMRAAKSILSCCEVCWKRATVCISLVIMVCVYEAKLTFRRRLVGWCNYTGRNGRKEVVGFSNEDVGSGKGT